MGLGGWIVRRAGGRRSAPTHIGDYGVLSGSPNGYGFVLLTVLMSSTRTCPKCGTETTDGALE